MAKMFIKMKMQKKW